MNSDFSKKMRYKPEIVFSNYQGDKVPVIEIRDPWRGWILCEDRHLFTLIGFLDIEVNQDSIAIGRGAQAVGNNAVAIGHGACTDEEK
jgi:hypothetical protein